VLIGRDKGPQRRAPPTSATPAIADHLNAAVVIAASHSTAEVSVPGPQEWIVCVAGYFRVPLTGFGQPPL
jgi:hypothetical protein